MSSMAMSKCGNNQSRSTNKCKKMRLKKSSWTEPSWRKRLISGSKIRMPGSLRKIDFKKLNFRRFKTSVISC